MHVATPETAKLLASQSAPPPVARGETWKWYICGLLLLATMLNYMDRMTLNLTATIIKKQLNLNNSDYGLLESAFAFAFAIGAIVFGWLADRINVRWLYPLAVLAWSVAGFATGLVGTFGLLLICRSCLGIFEAGNWPCALRTTQRILPPHQRPLGNSILQSGAAVGAILTPLVVMWLVGEGTEWGGPFFVIGALGLTWIVLWLPSVRTSDLALPPSASGPSLMPVLGLLVVLVAIYFPVRLLIKQAEFLWVPLTVHVAITVVGIAGVYQWLRHSTAGDDKLPRALFLRRFWVLVILVTCINGTWHFLRAWLPLFLIEQHLYTRTEANLTITAYNVATDVGSLTAGFAVLGLARCGLSVHGSRLLVFLGCALITTLSVVIAFLPAGPLLLGLLMVVGFAALGLFPVYYSFSQELTVKHQGKVTGALGCICWLSMALLHALIGDTVEREKSYTTTMALAGLAPLIGCAVMYFLWKPEAKITAQS